MGGIVGSELLVVVDGVETVGLDKTRQAETRGKTRPDLEGAGR